MLERDVNAIIDLIYEATLDDSQTPELLHRVTRAFRGCNASFGIVIPGLAPRFESLTPPEMVAQYLDMYAQDPWYDSIVSSSRSGAFLGTDLIDQSTYRHSSIYQTCNRPCDIEYMATGVCAPTRTTPNTWLLVNRSKQQGDFCADDRRILRHLHSHIARAGRLYLNRRRRADAEILSEYGHVWRVSEKASSLLEDTGILALEAHGVRSTDDATNRKLLEAQEISNATRESVSLNLPISGGTGRVLSISFNPMPSSAQRMDTRTTLTVRQAADPLLASLTAAERQLVEGLLRGLSVAEYAETTERSIHTVRTHVKNVLRKTGLRTQRELIARLSGYGTD